MAHIHTKPGQHDHTISIYLFRTDFTQPKVMLHLHRKIGYFTQFGGHVELHENPWQAAARELTEETGYSIDQVKLLQPHDRMTSMSGASVHPHPVVHATMGYPGNGGHFHTDSAYAFIVSEEPRQQPGEGESTDIRLFSRDEIISLGDNEIDGITRDTALYIFDECLKQWQPTSVSNFKL